jgi:hypothetical protein
MKLELKAIKFYEKLSEETNAFSANLYVNGKKAAECSNRGHGGENEVNAFDVELVRQAENHCESLPPIKTENFTLDMDLVMWIGEEVSNFIVQKELKKNFNKGLCITKDKKSNKYSIISWKGFTLSKVLKQPNGINLVRKQILKYKSEGYTILNTNLPKNILKLKS